MPRLLVFLYGLVAHLGFLAVFAWMALFVGDLLLPATIDAPAAPFAWGAVAVDVALVAVFGLSHSVMARPGFKRRWTRLVPQPIERSTYVLVSCAAMILLLTQWRPIDAVVWDVQAPALRAAIWTLFAIGWLAIPLVSLAINHFDLFGLRQVWLHLKRRPYTHLPFGTPGVYRFVRHPLYVGWMLAFWAIPTMTAGHLLFAALSSAYILLAIPFEERDLVAAHGDDYERYRRAVPALVPRLGAPAVAEAQTLRS